MSFPTFTHTYLQQLSTPEGLLQDAGTVTTGDSIKGGNYVVQATSGANKTVPLVFPATGFKSMLLFSDVSTTLTFAHASGAINGATTNDIVLEANKAFYVSAWTGACTTMLITKTAGAVAGTLSLSVLWDATYT